MEKQRRKELIQEFKDRKKELGIISFKCKQTGEVFLGISTDIKADFNSNKMKLNTGTHPNKKLLKLWQEYGSEGFELSIEKTLDYEDPTKDYTTQLEDIRQEMMSKDESIQKIWR